MSRLVSARSAELLPSHTDFWLEQSQAVGAWYNVWADKSSIAVSENYH